MPVNWYQVRDGLILALHRQDSPLFWPRAKPGGLLDAERPLEAAIRKLVAAEAMTLAARKRQTGLADLGIPLDLSPMEAKLVTELPKDSGWQFEPKRDGFRCLAFRAGGDVEIKANPASRSRAFSRSWRTCVPSRPRHLCWMANW
jgi:hypothetical protein